MQIETITPAKAKQYLATRASNRIIRDAKVLEYGIAMEAGRWVLNGHAIVFDDDGHLIDGQHRLEACVLSGCTFETYIVRGVKDPRAMATIDTGSARTHTDIWTIAGHKSAALTSSIALMVMMYEQKRINWNGFVPKAIRRDSPLAASMKKMPLAGSYVSKEELLGFGEAHIHSLTAAAHFIMSSPVRKVMSPQAGGTLYYYGEKKDAVAVGQFLNDVGSGVGLAAGDPALVLREHVAHRTRAGSRLSRTYILGMMIKAWNARRAGTKISVLRVGADEDFPRVK